MSKLSYARPCPFPKGKNVVEYVFLEELWSTVEQERAAELEILATVRCEDYPERFAKLQALTSVTDLIEERIKRFYQTD